MELIIHPGEVMMKTQRCEERDTNINNTCDTQSHQSHQPLKSKLERRRQIEELNEERRLNKEFYDF